MQYTYYMHNPSFDCVTVLPSITTYRPVLSFATATTHTKYDNPSFAHSFLNAATIKKTMFTQHPMLETNFPSEDQHCIRLANVNNVAEDAAAAANDIKKLHKSVKYTPSTTMKSKKCLLTFSRARRSRNKSWQNTTEQKRTRKSIAICGTVYFSPKSTHSPLWSSLFAP